LQRPFEPAWPTGKFLINPPVRLAVYQDLGELVASYRQYNLTCSDINWVDCRWQVYYGWQELPDCKILTSL